MTAGGAYTLKAATIEVLPIAIGTKEQQKEIALKVESILNAKAKTNKSMFLLQKAKLTVLYITFTDYPRTR